MTAPLPLRVRRFIVGAVCSPLVIAGVFLFMCIFTDLDSPSILGSACWWLLAIAMWPDVLCALIHHGDAPTFVYMLLFVA
jgi:hypothetical protein